MSLKRSSPALNFGGNAYKIVPDDTDMYVREQFINVGTSNVFWGTAAVGGTSSTGAITVTNRIPDYPRNILFSVTGTGAGMAGTVTVNGFDQFGSKIQETISLGTASNGGTTGGTKVFARLDNGTISYGTAVGNGTPRLGFLTGTSSAGSLYLGLPVRLGGTGDVVFMSHVAGTGAVSVNGGTVGGFVNVAQSAIVPAAAVTGTECINVWVTSSYDSMSKNIDSYSNLKQAS